MNEDDDVSLVQVYRSYEYKPHSLLYPDREHEFKYYSTSLKQLSPPPATLFTSTGNVIHLAGEVADRPLNSDKERWNCYNRLEANDRVRYLGLLSVDVHEL